VNVSAPEGDYLLAVTTLPSVEAARSLARALVERRLVACGTVLPGATSVYRWKGEVEESEEAVVLLKTTASRWAELAAALPLLHPYQVPELIAVPVVAGHRPYLEWLSAETLAGGGKE
jgi:periplasmic divalent cation tolerance protein